MKEEFLHYLWKYQVFNSKLKTKDSCNVTVLSPGIPNRDSGPDFFNSQIKINKTIWAGNIEIHIKSSDWFKHQHQNDEAYNSIILHVVFEHDKEIYRKNGEIIPTLELRNFVSKQVLNNYLNFNNSIDDIPCRKELVAIPKLDRINWFDFLATEKLEYKMRVFNIEMENTHNNFMKLFYQKIARSLGYTANADNMEWLAIHTPFKLLSKYSNDLLLIESLLFGQSGLLPDKTNEKYVLSMISNYRHMAQKHSLKPMSGYTWKFMRMRPANFPTVRISQLANLLFYIKFDILELLNYNSPKELIKDLSCVASNYWTTHYRFNAVTNKKPKIIGKSMINAIIINAIIPSMFLYGKINNDQYQEKALAWLSELKPENNRITRKFKKSGINAENTLDSQAIIHLYKNYCLNKRCISCKFGHLLIIKNNPKLF